VPSVRKIGFLCLLAMGFGSEMGRLFWFDYLLLSKLLYYRAHMSATSFKLFFYARKTYFVFSSQEVYAPSHFAQVGNAAEFDAIT
jgi:hypothetical protein